MSDDTPVNRTPQLSSWWFKIDLRQSSGIEDLTLDALMFTVFLGRSGDISISPSSSSPDRWQLNSLDPYDPEFPDDGEDFERAKRFSSTATYIGSPPSGSTKQLRDLLYRLEFPHELLTAGCREPHHLYEHLDAAGSFIGFITPADAADLRSEVQRRTRRLITHPPDDWEDLVTPVFRTPQERPQADARREVLSVLAFYDRVLHECRNPDDLLAIISAW
ncbi:MAG: hypothetical protein ACXVLM_18500 [Ilumatobacteraceae bacterium]